MTIEEIKTILVILGLIGISSVIVWYIVGVGQ